MMRLLQRRPHPRSVFILVFPVRYKHISLLSSPVKTSISWADMADEEEEDAVYLSTLPDSFFAALEKLGVSTMSRTFSALKETPQTQEVPQPVAFKETTLILETLLDRIACTPVQPAWLPLFGDWFGFACRQSLVSDDLILKCLTRTVTLCSGETLPEGGAAFASALFQAIHSYQEKGFDSLCYSTLSGGKQRQRIYKFLNAVLFRADKMMQALPGFTDTSVKEMAGKCLNNTLSFISRCAGLPLLSKEWAAFVEPFGLSTPLLTPDKGVVTSPTSLAPVLEACRHWYESKDTAALLPLMVIAWPATRETLKLRTEILIHLSETFAPLPPGQRPGWWLPLMLDTADHFIFQTAPEDCPPAFLSAFKTMTGVMVPPVSDANFHPLHPDSELSLAASQNVISPETLKLSCRARLIMLTFLAETGGSWSNPAALERLPELARELEQIDKAASAPGILALRTYLLINKVLPATKNSGPADFVLLWQTVSRFPQDSRDHMNLLIQGVACFALAQWAFRHRVESDYYCRDFPRFLMQASDCLSLVTHTHKAQLISGLAACLKAESLIGVNKETGISLFQGGFSLFERLTGHYPDHRDIRTIWLRQLRNLLTGAPDLASEYMPDLLKLVTFFATSARDSTEALCSDLIWARCLVAEYSPDMADIQTHLQAAFDAVRWQTARPCQDLCAIWLTVDEIAQTGLRICQRLYESASLQAPHQKNWSDAFTGKDSEIFFDRLFIRLQQFSCPSGKNYQELRQAIRETLENGVRQIYSMLIDKDDWNGVLTIAGRYEDYLGENNRVNDTLTLNLAYLFSARYLYTQLTNRAETGISKDSIRLAELLQKCLTRLVPGVSQKKTDFIQIDQTTSWMVDIYMLLKASLNAAGKTIFFEENTLSQLSLRCESLEKNKKPMMLRAIMYKLTYRTSLKEGRDLLKALSMEYLNPEECLPYERILNLLEELYQQPDAPSCLKWLRKVEGSCFAKPTAASRDMRGLWIRGITHLLKLALPQEKNTLEEIISDWLVDAAPDTIEAHYRQCWHYMQSATYIPFSIVSETAFLIMRHGQLKELADDCRLTLSSMLLHSGRRGQLITNLRFLSRTELGQAFISGVAASLLFWPLLPTLTPADARILLDEFLLSAEQLQHSMAQRTHLLGLMELESQLNYRLVPDAVLFFQSAEQQLIWKQSSSGSITGSIMGMLNQAIREVKTRIVKNLCERIQREKAVIPVLLMESKKVAAENSVLVTDYKRIYLTLIQVEKELTSS